jgi:hypothetical protein
MSKFVATKIFNIEEVMHKYEELKTLKAVAKYYDAHPECIRQLFIKNTLPYNKKVIYEHDENFFTNDTEESFYWAGFLAADGNITAKRDFALSLKASDQAHIEKFRTAIKSNAPLFFAKPEERIICGVKTTHSGSVGIRFRANKWFYDLQRFNIVPNKTKIYSLPPFLATHPLVRHFIRGYFEGDGWFSVSLNKKTQKNRVHWGICGNLDVIEGFREILATNCELTGKANPLQQNNIFKLIYSKQHDVANIVKYLYDDATIYLDRKYQTSKLVKQADEDTVILNLDKDILQEAYQRLGSYSKVAKELGCCQNSIGNYMRKYKLTPLARK